MTKAIVSVKNMLANLSMLSKQDEYDVKFDRGMVTIGNVVISCESQHFDRVYKVKRNRIERLIKVFNILEEQPATIAICEDNWLYIKEAIL
jgi:hypothetical protein